MAHTPGTSCLRVRPCIPPFLSLGSHAPSCGSLHPADSHTPASSEHPGSYARTGETPFIPQLFTWVFVWSDFFCRSPLPRVSHPPSLLLSPLYFLFLPSSFDLLSLAHSSPVCTQDGTIVRSSSPEGSLNFHISCLKISNLQRGQNGFLQGLSSHSKAPGQWVGNQKQTVPPGIPDQTCFQGCWSSHIPELSRPLFFLSLKCITKGIPSSCHGKAITSVISWCTISWWCNSACFRNSWRNASLHSLNS